MRLADFILANIEPILVEWEAFARGVCPAGASAADPAALRDHKEGILRAAARDMALAQTATDRYDKSRGDGDGSRRLDGASEVHAVGRVGSGFDLPGGRRRVPRAAGKRRPALARQRPGTRRSDRAFRLNAAAASRAPEDDAPGACQRPIWPPASPARDCVWCGVDRRRESIR
jgi:hypothetical protein